MIRRPPRSTRTDTLFPYTTLFRSLTEQIGLLIENHNVPVEIGVSDEPIPVHFAYAHDINVETVSLRASMTDGGPPMRDLFDVRSEEHTSELQSLMRNSYAVFCLKKKKQKFTDYATFDQR